MSFSSLGLSAELLRAVADQGYTEPTPVQSRAIPVVLAGRDLQAAAQTGTGKTAGFTLPLLQHLQKNPVDPGRRKPVRALVLTPTRELAAQVGESVQAYGKYLPFTTAVIFGGVNINPQIDKLRRGADIVVATPGRLLDHAQQKTIDLSRVEILVLDEGDRMLDMGFIRDIRRILALLPKQRQNLLFSATFSEDIRKLAAGLLHNPEIVDVAPRNSTAERVSQRVYHAEKNLKHPLLSWLISSGNWQQVLVFTRTKHGANRLCTQLQRDGIQSTAIHGNKSQGARTRALADFKQGRVRTLVATDIAARGLDIDQLPHVVNYELPNVPEDYVHRIGRTARAGNSGEAISLVAPDERGLLKDIERLLKQELPRATAEGFKPNPAYPKPEPGNHPDRHEHTLRHSPGQKTGWHSRPGSRSHGQHSARRRTAGRSR
ncbi:MAG: DEAD/DEAH box helicase [Gammaproteobacteria bacterium]|nr:DEAD/DEAH box helicase [Gammaproteobacteria bacterium]MDE2139234.1 DEAD/DEAH box helicase [Gammaproteobacteria bacterium]